MENEGYSPIKITVYSTLLTVPFIISSLIAPIYRKNNSQSSYTTNIVYRAGKPNKDTEAVNNDLENKLKEMEKRKPQAF